MVRISLKEMVLEKQTKRSRTTMWQTGRLVTEPSVDLYTESRGGPTLISAVTVKGGKKWFLNITSLVALF